MKHCQQCNLDFPDHYGFCGSCGQGLGESATCFQCGEVVESKWKFCTGCGSTIGPPLTTPAVAPLVAAPDRDSASQSDSFRPISAQHDSANLPAREWYAAPELFEEPDETTAASMRSPEPVTTGLRGSQPKATRVILPSRNGDSHSARNGKDVPTLTMLSAYGQPAESVANVQAQRRYPIFLVMVLVVFFAMVGFGGWYLWSNRAAAASSTAQSDASAAQPVTSSGFATASAGETSEERASAAETSDDEWKRLKQARIAAQPTERAAIIASLEQAEKKYPRDYRFPYERAKLSIKGIVSHHEAFSALSAAAEKAIDNGKAQEMLDNLIADADGDFYKPAHGHHEWHALLEALEKKNKSELSELHH